MKQQPLVSILLPIYNAAPFLKPCLQSLLSQSYKNIEVIALDDASKDRTFDILKATKQKNKRIRLYRNKKRYGTAICLNRALRRAKGSFITFMDAHDIATRDRIKRQVLYLMSYPSVVAVGTQAMVINELGKKLTKTAFPTDSALIAQGLLTGLSMQFETAMINKNLLPKDLLYFKHTAYPLLFSELFIKILSYGEIANLPWMLQQHRLPSSKSQGLALVSLIGLWLTSLASYDYRPPLRSLFSPLLRQA